MPDVRVRPYLASGLVYLGLGAVWALVVAFGPGVEPASTYLWLLLAGWLALSWLGLAFWYFPPFVKREIAYPRLAFLPLGLVHGALLALAVAALLGQEALALRLYLALAGAGLAAGALLVLYSAWRGKSWRGGVPNWRKDSTYRAGDRLAAWLALGALLQLVLAGVVLAAYPARGVGASPLVLLAAGFAAQGYAAFAAFLLPRNVKRPVGRAPAAFAGVVALSANAGVLVLALSFARPVALPWFLPGAVLAGVGVLLLGLFLIVEPFRGPLGRQGALLRGATPWLAASGAALAAAAGVAVAVFGGLVPAGALPRAAHLLVAGLGLAQAGLAVLAWPIVLNATPGRGIWGGAGAVLALAGLAALPLVGAAWASLLLAAAAAAHAAQVAPMREPRRECPPRMSAAD